MAKNKMPELMAEIDADLKKREREVVGIVCKTEEGKLQFLGYNECGLITFISECVEAMALYERTGKNMVKPIAEIGKK
jgi:hypothetical protein